MTIAVKGDTVPSSGIRGDYSKFGQRRVERTGRFNYLRLKVIKMRLWYLQYQRWKAERCANTYITTIGETGHAIFSASNNDAGENRFER